MGDPNSPSVLKEKIKIEKLCIDDILVDKYMEDYYGNYDSKGA